MQKVLTAQELVAIAEAERPGVRYTSNKRGDAIAAWHHGRWQMVAAKLITGEWVTMGNLLINGEPCNKDEDWLPLQERDGKRED